MRPDTQQHAAARQQPNMPAGWPDLQSCDREGLLGAALRRQESLHQASMSSHRQPHPKLLNLLFSGQGQQEGGGQPQKSQPGLVGAAACVGRLAGVA